MNLKPSPSKAGATWEIWTRFNVGNDEDPLLIRYRLIQTPFFGVFLHDIRRKDQDQDLHDHPWSFLSVLLRGGYVEQIPHTNPSIQDWNGLNARFRHGWHRRFSYKRAEDRHRIIQCSSEDGLGPCWTLMFVGRRRRHWGFHTRNGWVYWKDYVAASGQLIT